jgi:hypothetical protein
VSRELWIDEGLPAGLAEELRARGRAARAISGPLPDSEVLADAGAVLVTTLPLPGAAVVVGRTAEARRDAVHRHAHEMAAQRPGSTRRYRA